MRIQGVYREGGPSEPRLEGAQPRQGYQTKSVKKRKVARSATNN